jgi:hypothetical protein
MVMHLIRLFSYALPKQAIRRIWQERAVNIPTICVLADGPVVNDRAVRVAQENQLSVFSLSHCTGILEIRTGATNWPSRRELSARARGQ